MNDLEKLDLLNTMKFIDDDADGENCSCVIVEDNKINRDIIYRIGFDDEYIKREGLVTDEGYINIAEIAFKFSNWWAGDYFTDKEDEEAKITECRNFNCEHNKDFKCTLERIRLVVIENELVCENADEPTNAGITYLED